jgi:class 3 adenylate cyclase/predicted ATPase
MAREDALDVAAWLADLGLDQYAAAFAENGVDQGVLPRLTAEDLKEIGVAAVGHRRKLLDAIEALQASGASAPATAPRARDAERRQLTVMFIDLVGSTALAARLDPEAMREVLHAYQNAVTGEVLRFDGHVAKLMGDGVLAYFGWPAAHEDEAERAIRAALATVTAVARLAAPTGEPLMARVGIASGLVVVGNLIGEGAAQEEAVVGATPNLAARLQAVAEPGGVVIAEATRRLAGGTFLLRDLGPVGLKGLERPVPAFAVIGEQVSASRFEARQAGLPPPMVGREQELGLLLARWHQTCAGEGQAVLLVGEGGIGKSRLIRALLDATAATAHTPLRYQCSPLHGGTALWPVIQQLSFAADLGSAPSDTAKRERLEALLAPAAGGIAPALPLVAALLGIELPGQPPAEMSPQQRRARTLAVLIEQLLALARRRPVLMVVEDVHWIDPTTLELLGLVLPRIETAAVLLVMTSRPERQPPFGDHPHLTRLTVSRLGRAAAATIAQQVVASGVLPDDVLDTITARTDGVPLFVEELTKTVLETGRVAADALPASLHDSLLARLDRVPEAKSVAQAAACIGRDFTWPVLAGAVALDASELAAALVRDTAYASLLTSRRQQLHARIAAVLVERCAELVATAPELVARHYTEAGLAASAAAYWQRAGEQALARSAAPEAFAHLEQGLIVAASLPPGPATQRQELALQLAFAQAALAAKGFAAPETRRAYARARELCADLGEVVEQFPVLYGRFIVHFQGGDLPVAHEAALEMLRLATARGDVAAEVAAHRIIGSVLSHLGRLEESRRHLEQAVALYDLERHRDSALVYALDSRVVCLFWLVHVLFALGFADQARVRLREALAHARELGHGYTLAYAHAVAGMYLGRVGPEPEVRREAEALVAFAVELGFPLPAAVGLVVEGWALSAAGSVEDGIARMCRGLADYRATGATLWVPDLLALLADSHLRLGRAAAGLAVVQEALDRTEDGGSRWLEAELRRLQGELLLIGPEPRPDQAAAAFERALAVARAQGARMWELRAATSLARLRRDAGAPAEAVLLLGPVHAWFSEGLATPDLVAARRLLDELRAIAGRPAGRRRRPCP